MVVVQQQEGLLFGLIILNRSKRRKIYSISFEDELRGGLQGEGGPGYDSGWTSAEGFFFGHYHQLMPELQNEDPASFLNFSRMSPAMFKELLARLGPLITKQDTTNQNAI